jgi:membrane protein required for colicin V production
MQVWFGRIFLFAVIVSLGALVSWGLSKLVRVSLLAGMDRFLGSVFGLARAVLLVGLAVLAGQYAGFDNDDWWLDSMLIPRFEVVASWINVMAPQGYDLLTPDEPAKVLPVRMPDASIFSGDR